MWTGKDGLPLLYGWLRLALKLCGGCALIVYAAALLLTVPGCSSTSSARCIPILPVLTSLQRLTLDGVPGVWMNSDDAGRLALWIYDVTGVDGR